MMKRILLTLAFLLFAATAQATVAADDSQDRYNGDGTTVAFTYNFRLLDDDDIAVYVDNTLKVKTTDYSVSNVGSASGTVTFVAAPAKSTKVTLIRNQPISQLTNYIANSSYAPLTVMQDLDKNIMVDQMQSELLRRVPRFAVKSTYNGVTIDDPTALGYLRWKSDLSGIESVTSVISAPSSALNYLSIGNDTTLNVDPGPGAPFMVQSKDSFYGGDWIAWFRRESLGGAANEALIRFEHFSDDRQTLPIFAGIAHRGTIAAPTGIQANDYLLVIDGRGRDGSNTNHGEYALGVSDTAAQIAFQAHQNWGATAHGARIRFLTTPNDSTTPATRLGIEHDGTILINTTTSTGAAAGDTVMKNTGAYRFLSAGGVASSYGVISDADNNLEIAVPTTGDGINLVFGDALLGFFYVENGGLGLQFEGESSGDHAAPAANKVRIYTKDNGAGKTQVMARFASGSAVQIAIEP